MTEHRYHLTRLSQNTKLGGIPASVTSRSTCPDRCNFKNNGCYAEVGPLSWHWDRVDDGRRGGTLEEFCDQVRALPRHTMWRYAVAGDLPGDGTHIDPFALHHLVSANRGRRGFGFSHYDPRLTKNASALEYANQQKFTINLSAETLEEVDEFMALGIAPVVVVLPVDQVDTVKTPAGNTVMVCPASIGNTTCALCGICAEANRKFAVGFPAHGGRKRKVEAIFMAEATT